MASATRLLAAIVLVGVLLAVVLVYVLIGTSAGSRFLAARAKPYLPTALSFSNVDGTLLSSVTIEGLRWHDDNVDVRVPAVTVDVALRPLLRREVRLESVRAHDVAVTGLGANETPAATPGDEPLVVDLPVAIVVDDLQITKLMVTSGDIREIVDAVTLKAALSGAKLTVDRIDISSPWLGLQITGRGFLAPPYEFDARVDWQQARWSSDAPDISSAGRLDMDGSLDSFQIAVSAEGETAPVGDLSLRIEGEGNAREVRVLNAQIQSGAARVNLAGEMLLGAEGSRWNTTASMTGFDLARLKPDIEGTVAMTGTVRGEMPGWAAPHTEVTIDSLTGMLFGKPLTGGGTLSLDQSSVSLTGVIVGTGENEIRIDGRLAQKIALAVRVDADDLGAVLPDISGRLDGELEVTGSLELPRVGGRLEGVKIGFNDLRAEKLWIEGGGDSRGELRVEVHADGISRGDQRVEFVNAILSGDLATHAVTIDAGHMGNTAALALKGGYGDGLWSGQLTQADTTFAGDEHWTLVEPANVETSADGQSVSELCMSAEPDRRVCAEFGAVAADEEWYVNVAVVSFPLAPFVESRLPRLQTSGRISANAALEFRNDSYQGTFDAYLDETVLSFREADAEGQVAAASQPAAVDPVPVTLALNGTIDSSHLSTSGEFGFGESGSGSFNAEVDDVGNSDSLIRSSADFALSDLSFASLFLPGADVRGGELTGEMTVAGSVNAPTIGGALRLDGADVTVFAAGSEFKDVAFELVPGKAGEINFEGSARAGEGRVDVRGVTAIDAEAGWPTRLGIQGQDIHFIRLPDWTVVASPDLNVELTTKMASVSGTITVPSASIKLDQLPETAESPSPDTTVHREGDESRRRGLAYELNLSVVVEEGVHLQGFGLDTALAGRLEIDGTDTSALRGVGELNLIDGRFEAYGQKLEIERGRLNFTGSLANPLLDFRATRQIDDLTVGILMGGSVEQPRSSLFSDPAMSEASALALLVTGRPLESAGESDGNLVAGAAIALGLKRAGNIGAEIGATLGLDDFSIEGGSTDGRVLAGKRVGKNLYLRYAFGIFDKIGSLLLRYQLSERLTFESESGEEQSLDLIYSVDRQ